MLGDGWKGTQALQEQSHLQALRRDKQKGYSSIAHVHACLACISGPVAQLRLVKERGVPPSSLALSATTCLFEARMALWQRKSLTLLHRQQG